MKIFKMLYKVGDRVRRSNRLVRETRSMEGDEGITVLLT